MFFRIGFCFISKAPFIYVIFAYRTCRTECFIASTSGSNSTVTYLMYRNVFRCPVGAMAEVDGVLDPAELVSPGEETAGVGPLAVEEAPPAAAASGPLAEGKLEDEESGAPPPTIALLPEVSHRIL